MILCGVIYTGTLRLEKVDICWKDIAGLDVAQDVLTQAVVFPSRFPHLFTGTTYKYIVMIIINLSSAML